MTSIHPSSSARRESTRCSSLLRLSARERSVRSSYSPSGCFYDYQLTSSILFLDPICTSYHQYLSHTISLPHLYLCTAHGAHPTTRGAACISCSFILRRPWPLTTYYPSDANHSEPTDCTREGFGGGGIVRNVEKEGWRKSSGTRQPTSD